MARPKIQLDSKLQASLKDASLLLTGVKKRAFIAQATQDYFQSSPRLAETYMGWSRKAIAMGLKELETGIFCQDNNQAKGRKKTEENTPQLEDDIRSLVDEKSQADPKFQTVFCYARISAPCSKTSFNGGKSLSKRRITISSNYWCNVK